MVEAEGGVPEDQRSNDRDLVGLEEVGGHTGAVAHVVTHVVGDGGRIARVVLRNAGFHLAHQVGAHISRLGEDAAADSHEEGEQGGPEREADQDGRGRVLEDEDDGGGADEAEAHAEHAGHGTGAEGDPQGLFHAAAPGGRGRCTHVAPHGDAHADEAGQAGEGRAEEEADHPVETVLLEGQGDRTVRPHHFGGGEEDQDGQGDDDHRNGPELARQERLGPLLDRQRDLLHFGGALVEREDVAGQEQPGDDADDAGDQADVQPGLVDSTEVEGLVAALGCEHSDHSRCALSVPVRLAGRGWRRPPPCGAAALNTIAFDVITPGRRRAGGSHPTPGRGGR